MTLIMGILVRWDESYIPPNRDANVQWTGAADSAPGEWATRALGLRL